MQITCKECNGSNFLVGEIVVSQGTLRTGNDHRSVLICEGCNSTILFNRIIQANRESSIKLNLNHWKLEFPHWTLDKVANVNELLNKDFPRSKSSLLLHSKDLLVVKEYGEAWHKFHY